jgi:hypothetical protein
MVRPDLQFLGFEYTWQRENLAAQLLQRPSCFLNQLREFVLPLAFDYYHELCFKLNKISHVTPYKMSRW